jgi:hypothetical protein
MNLNSYLGISFENFETEKSYYAKTSFLYFCVLLVFLCYLFPAEPQRSKCQSSSDIAERPADEAARNTIRHSWIELRHPLNLKSRKKNVRMQLNGLSLRWAQNPAADLNNTLPILKKWRKVF